MYMYIYICIHIYIYIDYIEGCMVSALNYGPFWVALH